MNDSLTGIQALLLAKEISKMPDGVFTIAFYPYSRSKGEASNKLSVKHNCKARVQLPDERWKIDSENYFLFSDEFGKHQTCYKILIRFMGFPHDNFKLRKLNWTKHD
jgi:hypothetical protein